MNYENASDSEINEAVTRVIASKAAKSFGKILINELGISDYCNDWAYGGLIIQSAKISVEYDKSEDYWAAHQGDYLIGKYVSKCGYRHQYSHKNPLRAAMIVFLMMDENKL